MSTTVKIILVACRGCGGRGWVDSIYRGAQVCPICLGTGVQPPTNQTYEG